ncbi:ThuA domain-containing protein [Sphingomonas sp. CFBP 13733]|uniref:ThuA domain-containing protein n=1 Tax=Sphingomonas sp. CFBP 13733 TaxID=2775291 RepID=UPI00178473EB|nr:ThuA domain-containing protein [Sphingomonas sp. CFBP 13733]MBD8639630.1 ThuA domain-containing protein [Sphingomonas sp. CFBP 13733]
MLKMLALAALLTTAQAAPDPHLPKATTDTVAPVLPKDLHDAVLIVSKTNGWRHIEHIPHSNRVLADIVQGLGRTSYATENAAVFNDEQLRHFSVVVLNSASGGFLTPDQRAAFARFVARGGGVVALHAAGDDSHTDAWYSDTVIGTKFIGHPGGEDQFQRARLVVDRPDHPVMAGVRLPWTAVDEWYSFNANPAARGMTVLATLDEASYRPGAKLAMGTHPVIWTNPRTKGRVVYSALGHLPEAYDDPTYRRVLVNAIRWAGRQ